MDAFLAYFKIGPEVPRDRVDWDAVLVSVDWAAQNWRDVLHLELVYQIPWHKLGRTTLEYLEMSHNLYDASHGIYPMGENDETFRWSPAQLELGLRDQDEKARPTTFTNEQDVREWVGVRYLDNDVAWQERAPAGEDWPRDPGHEKNPFFTGGFELELPIAVYRRTRFGIEDPHPDETRWQADLSDENGVQDRALVQKITVDRVCEVLNSQTDMVFVPWDQSRATGEAYEEPPPQPNQADTAVALWAQHVAYLAQGKYFNPSNKGRHLAGTSDSDIEKAVQSMDLSSLNMPVDQGQVRFHATAALKQQVDKARRVPNAAVLPHMKKRYEAFSVYAMQDARFDFPLSDADRRAKDYVDSPQGNYDPYHWEVIKISSPAMLTPPDFKTLNQALRDVCRVVRNNFCVHRDIPSIPVTTQINISNLVGFDLLDLKKFVSLYTILREKGLYRVHREHRSKRSYDDVCGPIKKVSRLGGISCMEYESIENAGDETYYSLPHPPDDERSNRMVELEAHLPTDMIPALHGQGKLSDRIFWGALWSYANITRLSRGLSTVLPSRKSDIMVKVTGDGTRSNFVPKEYSPPHNHEHLSYNIVDTHRGVLEFRAMGGSLHAEHILCWYLICSNIVFWSKFYTVEQFKRIVAHILRADHPILEILGLPKEVQNFYRNNLDAQREFFEPPDARVSWADPFYPPEKVRVVLPETKTTKEVGKVHSS